MTLAQLGKHTKALHPAYAQITDAQLGRMVQQRYPELYGHIGGDLDGKTMPETPRTLQLQLEQLAEGLRRVVFIARGSKAKVIPAEYGARKLVLPSGEYVYDPKRIKPREIIAAVQNHELSEILGTADRGYGTPDKTELQGPVQAVVARDEDGETVHSALTDQEHQESALDAADDLRPTGGNVSLESPEIELRHRAAEVERPDPSPQGIPLKPKAGGRWPKPGRTI